MPNRDPKLSPRLPKGMPVEREESTGVGVSRSEAAALAVLDEPTDLVPAFEHDDEESTALVSLESLGRIEHHEAKDRHLLVRVKGAGLGQVTRLGDKPCYVGRGSEAGLYVSDSGVSRKHAMLIPDGETYVLIDTESANGTFVAGQRVSRHVLRDGDVVQFASTASFRYTLTDASQEALLRQLFEASVTDALTGAFNRDHFDTQLAAELSYARRHKTELSLVMFDVDFFKKVNDTYGHPAGDQVLVRIARTVASMVRTEDVFARYGGEEFALILRGVNVTGAAALAERLRGAVQALTIPSDRGPIRVTISAGCAAVSGGAEISAEELVGAADKRLYAAKHGGRNRVHSAD